MRVILLAAVLLVHDWYPSECCQGQDCRPIPCDAVRQKGIVYLYQPPGFPAPLLFSRARKSKDEQCHACYIQIPSSANGAGRCLFLPDHIV